MNTKRRVIKRGTTHKKGWYNILILVRCSNDHLWICMLVFYTKAVYQRRRGWTHPIDWYTIKTHLRHIIFCPADQPISFVYFQRNKILVFINRIITGSTATIEAKTGIKRLLSVNWRTRNYYALSGILFDFIIILCSQWDISGPTIVSVYP